jgi:hypothetical protein
MCGSENEKRYHIEKELHRFFGKETSGLDRRKNYEEKRKRD